MISLTIFFSCIGRIKLVKFLWTDSESSRSLRDTESCYLHTQRTYHQKTLLHSNRKTNFYNVICGKESYWVSKYGSLSWSIKPFVQKEKDPCMEHFVSLVCLQTIATANQPFFQCWRWRGSVKWNYIYTLSLPFCLTWHKVILDCNPLSMLRYVPFTVHIVNFTIIWSMHVVMYHIYFKITWYI